MANPGDVVDRADALMRQRRSFVAKAPAPAVSEPAAGAAGERAEYAAAAIDKSPRASALDAADELDDLPVLTDIVAFEEDGNATGNRLQERIDETQVALLAAQIAHAIGEQLASDLPRLVEAALDSAGEQLSRGIGETMETALHDFIARRRQLALPLDEARDADV